MSDPKDLDGVLVQWGDRLFCPGNRIVRPPAEARLRGQGNRQRAAELRERIEATVVRRAPQMMVKVTGGGRIMPAIVAQLRYITENGRLADERCWVEFASYTGNPYPARPRHVARGARREVAESSGSTVLGRPG